MLYEAMKWLVEWLLTTYQCECGNTTISEKNIDIIWAAWNTVNFDIMCSKCGKHWMIKSQLLMVDLNQVAEVKHSIEAVKDKLKTNSISDKEIVNLSKDLKEEKINVSDLFN